MRVTEAFSSQQEAEAHMSHAWASMVREGVTSVALTADDEVIYDMELGAAT